MIDVTERVYLNKAIGELDDALVALEKAERHIRLAESNLRVSRNDPRGERVIESIQPVRWWRDELIVKYHLLRSGTA